MEGVANKFFVGVDCCRDFAFGFETTFVGSLLLLLLLLLVVVMVGVVVGVLFFFCWTITGVVGGVGLEKLGLLTGVTGEKAPLEFGKGKLPPRGCWLGDP